MNLALLISLIEVHGLSVYQTELLANVRLAIALHLGQAQPGQVGQSRIGGVPDLPASITWRQDDRQHKYLDFLLQINLAELPVFPENPFPPQGMLYLFASDDEDPQQFVFYPGSEPLMPAHLPETAQFATDWYDDLIAHQLTFTLFADLPRWATSDYEALCNCLQVDEDRYEELTRSLSSLAWANYSDMSLGLGMTRVKMLTWFAKSIPNGCTTMNSAASWT